MKQLLLDSANIDEIDFAIKNLPISGITTNPTILKKEGRLDLNKHINKLLSYKVPLHVQVVSLYTKEIIKEAKGIAEKYGKDIYIKIPATIEGIPAIKELSKQGYKITATAIYSSYQGILAIMAGAKYVAIYFNRMQTNNLDPVKAIQEMRNFIDSSNTGAQILGASFKTIKQIMDAYTAGCDAITASLSIIKEGLDQSIINDAVKKFTADFEEVYGENTNMIKQ